MSNIGGADLPPVEAPSVPRTIILGPTWEFPKIRGTLFLGPYYYRILVLLFRVLY